VRTRIGLVAAAPVNRHDLNGRRTSRCGGHWRVL